MVSRKEAIEIAKQKAIKLEYNVSTMRVEATVYDELGYMIQVVYSL